MVRYFILIKKKGSDRYLGAIPARQGISLSQLQSAARKQIKAGFSYRIVTEVQLRRILPGLLKKNRSSVKSKHVRRRVKRIRRRLVRKVHRRKHSKRRVIRHKRIRRVRSVRRRVHHHKRMRR